MRAEPPELFHDLLSDWRIEALERLVNVGVVWRE